MIHYGRTRKKFTAKLDELQEKFTAMQARIAELENAEPEEVHQARAQLEEEWAALITELKNRSRAMRFLTGQQLSQMQLDYCQKAANILHTSMKQSWQAVAGDSESDNAALYAEYAIDFAAMAMRYALLSVATAIDMQNQESLED